MKRFILIILISWIPVIGFSQGCEEVSDDGGIKLFGYIQPEYKYNFTDPSSNTFRFQRARIGVTGVIPYDFSYYAMIEMSPLLTGNAHLLDAFVSYNRFGWAKAAIGQFKAPFSRDVQTACHSLPLINRSKTANELAGNKGNIRDMGVMISGGNDTTLVRYQFAIMNGSALNNLDDNSDKEYIGRVLIQPLPMFNIGASYRYGSNLSMSGVPEDDTHTGYGFEAQFKFKRFLLQGEYIYREDIGSYAVGGGCGEEPTFVSGSIERRGYYGIAAYMFDFGLQPVVRFEMYDADMSVDNLASNNFTFGINYFFNDWTRLQVNYCYVEESSIEQIDNDQFIIQMQIKF